MDVRADVALVQSGMVSSRARAQMLIKAGVVKVNICGTWLSVQKTSQKLPDNSLFKIEQTSLMQYVSRAGLKLERVLKRYVCIKGIEAEDNQVLNGLLALDIGQSTGGFTDCLLQHGAKHVVGVDVGHGQLHTSLQNHPRVTAFEGVNAKRLTADILQLAPEGFDLVVMDISFISQTKVLEEVANALKADEYLISLVKPQFEVGPEGIGKKGIVKSEYCTREALSFVEKSANKCGFEIILWEKSPIKGGDGNQEFLMIARLENKQ